VVATTDDLRQLLHALREPVGAFAIKLALLDDEQLSDDARRCINQMLSEVERMAEAISAISSHFRLEVGDATPLAIISQNGRAPRRARI